MGGCASAQKRSEGEPHEFSSLPRLSKPEQKVLDRIRAQSPYLCFLCRHFSEYDPMLLTRFESLRYISFQECAQTPVHLADMIVKQCNGISHLAQLSFKFVYKKNSRAMCARGVVWFGDLKESSIVTTGNAVPAQNDAQQLSVDMRTVLNMTWAPLFVDNIVNSVPEKPTLVQTFPLRARLLSPAMIELYNLLQCFLDVRAFGFYPHAGQVHVVIAYRTHRYSSIPNTPRVQVQQSLMHTPKPRDVAVHKDSFALRALLQIPQAESKFESRIRSPVSLHSLASPRIGSRGKPSRSLITHAALSPRSVAARRVAQFAQCAQHVGPGSPPNARVQVEGRESSSRVDPSGAASGSHPQLSRSVALQGQPHPCRDASDSNESGTEPATAPARCVSGLTSDREPVSAHSLHPHGDASDMHSEHGYKSPASPIRRLNDFDSKSVVFTRASSSIIISDAASVHDSHASSPHHSR
jgi:hypothetical protein